MQYYFYVLNTIALLVSLLLDFLVDRKISVYTSLLTNVLILETIFGYLLAKYFGNNIVIYNLLIISIIAHYFWIFAKEKARVKLILSWLFLFLSVSFIFGFETRVYTELFIIGLLLMSYIIISYFFNEIFVVHISFLWSKPKTYLGLGIILFFTCSFPLLLFYHSITKLGGAYLVFYNLLMIGNIVLSTSYLITSIMRWKKV